MATKEPEGASGHFCRLRLAHLSFPLSETLLGGS